MLVSVLLPIRNEEKFIKNTLLSIVNQDYNKQYIEVLIADGCSTDNTVKVCLQFKNQFSRFNVFENQKLYVSYGFNRLLLESSGDFILRLDGHSEICSNYISSCVNYLKSNINVSCVGGWVKHFSNDFTAKLICNVQCSSLGTGGVAFRNKPLSIRYVDTLAFGCYRRNVFKTIGAYDYDLVRNQDDEHSLRMNQNNLKLCLLPYINSTYFVRSSLKKLFFQYFGYGFYKIIVFVKRNTFASFRHLVPLIFVISTISILLLSIRFNFNYLFFYFLYLIPVFIYSFYSLLKIKSLTVKSFTLTFFSFLTLHFAYGIGQLYSILKLPFMTKKLKSNFPIL